MFDQHEGRWLLIILCPVTLLCKLINLDNSWDKIMHTKRRLKNSCNPEICLKAKYEFIFKCVFLIKHL